MNTTIAFSINTDAAQAVKELKNKLAPSDPAFILYFASSAYNPQTIAIEMNAAFPAVSCFGCTTAGELVSDFMLKDSVVAMCFNNGSVEEFEVAALQNISRDINLASTALQLEKKLGRKLSSLEHDKYFGIILVDGLSGKEEQIMDELGNLSDIMFIGGSAGDDLNFNKTFLFKNDDAFSDGALIAIVKPKMKFGFIKTQSFSILEKTLMPTRVDEKTRTVIEFNNRPAVEYYSEITGIPENDISQAFMKHPVGLVVNGEPFVRSPRSVKGKSIQFYCNIKQGVELKLLESTDIIVDTASAIDNYIKHNGPISGIINFNCILRTLELEKQGLTEEYARIFKKIPTIGFSTYGEEFIGHINQTATMLVFH